MSDTQQTGAMQKVPAVFEGGVLRPLEPLTLPEHQHVEITITVPVRRPEEVLAAWQSVYAGLSEEEIDEIERLTRDRSHFSSSRLTS